MFLDIFTELHATNTRYSHISLVPKSFHNNLILLKCAKSSRNLDFSHRFSMRFTSKVCMHYVVKTLCERLDCTLTFHVDVPRRLAPSSRSIAASRSCRSASVEPFQHPAVVSRESHFLHFICLHFKALATEIAFNEVNDYF